MPNEIPSFAHAHVARDTRGVYTLRIENAKSINILTSAVIDGVTTAARWIAGREDARAVVLRGHGEKAFVAGADIYEMSRLDRENARRFISSLRALCDAVRAIPVPTIARIPGFCLGGGLELAAACDIRLGSELAKFGMPEVRVGIPSVIHAALLPKLIGPGATNWLLMTGETVDADQALKWGLLQFKSEHADLDRLVEKTLDAILMNGSRAVRSQKALLRYWEEASLADSMERSVEAFAAAYATNEPAEYMARFMSRDKSTS